MVVFCLAGVLLGGCQMLKPVVSSDGTGVSDAKPVDRPSVKDRLVKMEEDADNLVSAGKFKKALNKYNYLIPLVSGDEKSRIIAKVEGVLPRLAVEDIEKILQSDQNAIPESLILYRLGISHAAKGEYGLARGFLTDFLEQYPNDKDVEGARNALEAIQRKSVKKNTIGCILPLSGRFGVFGQKALKGVQLALMEISSENKNRIRILIKDSASDNKTAVRCVRELISEDVVAIAGPMVTAEAAAEEAQKHGIPMVVMTQKTGVIAKGDYVFSNFLTPGMQVEGLVSHAMRHLGVKRFAIIYPDDKYGEKYMNLYWDTVKIMGGDLKVIESYGTKQTDFSDIIKKNAHVLMAASDAAESPYCAVFIPDSPSKLSLILPQLVYNEIGKIYLLGTNIWHRDVLIKNAGDYVKNAVITEGYFSKSRKKEASAFAEKFKGAYGKDPGFIEAIAYDTASILINTAMDPAVDSRKALKEALAGKQIFNGVTGKTMFEASGAPHKELFFLTVKNKKFVEIDQSLVSEP